MPSAFVVIHILVLPAVHQLRLTTESFNQCNSTGILQRSATPLPNDFSEFYHDHTTQSYGHTIFDFILLMSSYSVFTFFRVPTLSIPCWINLPLVTLEITYPYSKVKNNFTKKYALLLATICVASC